MRNWVLITVMVFLLAVGTVLYLLSNSSTLLKQPVNNQVPSELTNVDSKQNVINLIGGTVTINYSNIPDYQSAEDDLYVDVSVYGKAGDPFGATFCTDSKKENCVWLVDQTGVNRTYEYSVSFSDAGSIQVGEKYIVSINDRISTKKSGNVGNVHEEKIVTVSKPGKTLQNFNVEVQYIN